MIYQHATADRDRALAVRLNDMIVTARSAVLRPGEQEHEEIIRAVAGRSPSDRSTDRMAAQS
jgi:hypothetical protein